MLGNSRHICLARNPRTTKQKMNLDLVTIRCMSFRLFLTRPNEFSRNLGTSWIVTALLKDTFLHSVHICISFPCSEGLSSLHLSASICIMSDCCLPCLIKIKVFLPSDRSSFHLSKYRTMPLSSTWSFCQYTCSSLTLAFSPCQFNLEDDLCNILQLSSRRVIQWLFLRPRTNQILQWLSFGQIFDITIFFSFTSLSTILFGIFCCHWYTIDFPVLSSTWQMGNISSFSPAFFFFLLFSNYRDPHDLLLP